ncbi:threonylcarbamoyladenosine tRNA methylthiotransferase [Labeo rohita]|uniref:Threonylcarbamoyladenosine tRNA methylthiotransferase n=1 Tax=Labeo rohita TaxID=84645 RepID=A0A498NTN2_LABRO|nr:threonylcarbamoyladenosine tRNA methylthiotransferase [Labeo rohita]
MELLVLKCKTPQRRAPIMAPAAESRDCGSRSRARHTFTAAPDTTRPTQTRGRKRLKMKTAGEVKEERAAQRRDAVKHLHTCSSCSTEDGPSSAAVAELVQMFELLKDTFMDSTVWPLARPKSVQMLNPGVSHSWRRAQGLIMSLTLSGSRSGRGAREDPAGLLRGGEASGCLEEEEDACKEAQVARICISFVPQRVFKGLYKSRSSITADDTRSALSPQTRPCCQTSLNSVSQTQTQRRPGAQPFLITVVEAVVRERTWIFDKPLDYRVPLLSCRIFRGNFTRGQGRPEDMIARSPKRLFVRVRSVEERRVSVSPAELLVSLPASLSLPMSLCCSLSADRQICILLKAQEQNKKVVVAGCVPQAQPRMDYLKELSIIGVSAPRRVTFADVFKRRSALRHADDRSLRPSVLRAETESINTSDAAPAVFTAADEADPDRGFVKGRIDRQRGDGALGSSIS